MELDLPPGATFAGTLAAVEVWKTLRFTYLVSRKGQDYRVVTSYPSSSLVDEDLNSGIGDHLVATVGSA